MKTRIFIFLIFVFFIQSGIAQEQSLLNLGISTDFNAISLSGNSLLSNSTVVDVCYNLNEDLNFKIGYEGSVLKESQKKYYTDLSGVLIGFGYYLNHKRDKVLNTGLFASFTNAFNNFSDFNNYHCDLGVRFYYKKFFYIGTSVRYSNNNLTISDSRNNFNWNWNMGIQIPVLKILK